MQAALKSVAEVLNDNNRGVAENNYRKSQSYQQRLLMSLLRAWLRYARNDVIHQYELIRCVLIIVSNTGCDDHIVNQQRPFFAWPGGQKWEPGCPDRGGLLS